MCQDDGTFTRTLAKCAPIPCTMDDITSITPLSGIFETDPEDIVEKDKSVTFTCTDEAKVPNNGLDAIEATCLLGGVFEWPNKTIEWPEDPGCVYTCSNFPNVPKMKKVSNRPVLAGRAIEYKCRNDKKVPHTGERFFINCTDIGKFEGELENFPGDDWPDCVIGCVEFPVIENYKAIDKMFKLPNDTTEYDCAKAGLIPHTGENLVLLCLENGTFINTTEVPKCVRPDTCREPFFPEHSDYIVANTERVAYNFGEYLEVLLLFLERIGRAITFFY